MSGYLLSILESYAASYSGLTSKCWQGIFLSFFEAALIGVYYFLPLYFVHQLHFSVATSGAILSFYGMGTILGGIMGGRLSDQMSPGIVSIGSLVLQAIVLLLLIKLKTLHLLAFSLFIMGIASYGFITSNHLWVLDQCNSSEAQKLKAINILNAASNLGFAVSAIVISCSMAYGFQNILFFAAGLLSLSALYFFYLEKQIIVVSEIKESSVTDVSNQIETHAVKKNKKILWTVLGCVFLVGLVIFQMSTTYSLYIQSIFPELGMRGVGGLFALNALLIVAFQAPIVSFFSGYNKIDLVGIGAFLIGLGMLMLAISHVYAVVIVACMTYTLGEILFFSVAQFVCYQSGAKKKKGQSLGLYRTVYASSRVIGPAVGACIYQQWSGDMLWFLCGVVGSICLMSCLFNKRYA